MAGYGLYTLLTATGTATGEDLTCSNNDRRTFQAVCTGTGAVTADIILEGSNNKQNWITLSTISLSGTAPQTGSFDHYSAWTFIRARTQNVTGTNATVTVTVSLNRLDSDFASSPIVPKWSTDAAGNVTGLVGPDGVVASTQFVRRPWSMLAEALPYARLVPGMGSSAGDTTRGRAASNTIYVDANNGSDLNAGTSAAAPRRTLPSAAAANTKYLLATRGRVFKYGLVGAAFLIAQPGVVVGCYDPLTGSEVFGQPNPYARALAGGWVSDEERASLYAVFEGASAENGAYVGTEGKGIGASNASPPLIRGLLLRNWGYAAVNGPGGNAYRVEDCIIEDNARTPSPANSYFGGCGLRFEGATAPGAGQVVRCFISGSGEDAIWAAGGALGVVISDNAIVHTAQSGLYNQQHTDVIQFSGYPGNFVIRRNVIEHRIAKAARLDTGAGVGNTGAAVIMTGSGTDTPGGVIEDNIICTDNILFNMQGQSGYTKTRNLGYGRMGVNSLQEAHFALNVEFASSTETDCVWVYRDHPSNYAIRAGGGVASRTRVVELLQA